MLSGTEYCSTASYGEATATYGEAWHCGSAEQEARCLLPLLHAGGLTLADVLNLIRVPQEEGRLLLAFTEKYPELKWKVERSLDYRLRVEKEFCRLADDGHVA